MKKRIPTDIQRLSSIRDTVTKMQAIRLLYPANLSWIERLERLATDGPFQWAWLQILRLLLFSLPEKIPEHFTDSTERAFGKAHLKLVYGRYLSQSALSVVVTLSQLGVPRRDLRLAVFCRYIQNDGSIRVNNKKEIFLKLAWWILVMIVALAIIDLANRMLNAHLSYYTMFTVIVCTIIIFLILLYPYYVLSLRASNIGAEVLKLSKRHLLGR